MASPTPAATPTPLPVAADVVAPTIYAAGEFELRIVTGDVGPVVFQGGFSDDAVELLFELADFLEFAALADPSLIEDPLAAQASDLLAGPWTVRVVEGETFVQQELLVSTAEGDPGDWVMVEDPLISDLLGQGGVFAGGLDHDVAVDIVRSAGMAFVWVGESEVGELAVSSYEAVIDGPSLSARRLNPAETAALAGIADLHLVQTSAKVWLDETGVLAMLMLDVSSEGFGTRTAGAKMWVEYRSGVGGVVVVPDNGVGRDQE